VRWVVVVGWVVGWVRGLVDDEEWGAGCEGLERRRLSSSAGRRVGRAWQQMRRVAPPIGIATVAVQAMQVVQVVQTGGVLWIVVSTVAQCTRREARGTSTEMGREVVQCDATVDRRQGGCKRESGRHGLSLISA
jgi:hypothetical protein